MFTSGRWRADRNLVLPARFFYMVRFQAHHPIHLARSLDHCFSALKIFSFHQEIVWLLIFLVSEIKWTIDFFHNVNSTIYVNVSTFPASGLKDVEIGCHNLVFWNWVEGDTRHGTAFIEPHE